MSEIMMRPCGSSWSYCDGDCEICRKVGYTKLNSTVTTKTNADHIRSMTDEELAKFLCGISACFFENCPGAHLCTSDGGSANGIVKWLKQPYKEDT